MLQAPKQTFIYLCCIDFNLGKLSMLVKHVFPEFVNWSVNICYFHTFTGNVYMKCRERLIACNMGHEQSSTSWHHREHGTHFNLLSNTHTQSDPAWSSLSYPETSVTAAYETLIRSQSNRTLTPPQWCHQGESEMSVREWGLGGWVLW